jgi:putative flippase GtrA
MKRFSREVLNYAGASGVALVVDVAVLWTLVRFFSWWYLAAATTSFLTGMVVAYVISVTFVFAHRRIHSRRAEFLSFAAIGGAGLAMNSGMMLIAVNILAWHYLVAKSVAACFVFSFNFIARRQLLFLESPIARDE